MNEHKPLSKAQKDAAHRDVSFGGQAVLEGIMMRSKDRWAVAVRKPEGGIYLERYNHGLTAPNTLFTLPLMRGMYALWDSLKVGMKGLEISTQVASGEDEEISNTEMTVTILITFAIFIGVFIVLPNAGLAWVAPYLGGGDSLLFHLVEGIVRLLIFIGYLAGISQIGDIKETFRYHGAEHKCIATIEAGEPLSVASIQRFSTKHPRCGTNFLVLVMILAIIVYTAAGFIVKAPPGGGILAFITYQVLLRIVLLPLIAGLSYEVLKFGDAHAGFRWLATPGIWLQYITTKEPDAAMVEVAVRSMQAAVPEQVQRDLGVVIVEEDFMTPVIWGHDDLGEHESEPEDPATLDHSQHPDDSPGASSTLDNPKE